MIDQAEGNFKMKITAIFKVLCWTLHFLLFITRK